MKSLQMLVCASWFSLFALATSVQAQEKKVADRNVDPATVTDAGLKELAALTNLSPLDLKLTLVTDAGLQAYSY